MKLTNKIFWIVWGVCLCYFVVILYTVDHGRGLAGGTLMLFSLLFLLATTALCSLNSKRTALINLIVAVVYNAMLFFSFSDIHGEGRRLLLMFSILFINGCQGIGLLLYLPIIKKENGVKSVRRRGA